jgi:hypothetical protein
LNFPSGSSIDRAFACPPSMVYEHLRELGSAHWSRRGSALHLFLSSVPRVGREAALELVSPEYREACEAIELEKLPAVEPEAYAYEVAMAYDIDTEEARELGRNMERHEAYALARPGEVVGTMDVVGLAGDSVVVLDYKTGYRWFESIETNGQLLFYLLTACRTYGRKRGDVGVIRLDQEGHPYFLWASITEEMLNAFAQKLRDLRDTGELLELQHARGERLEPVTGDHCQYCPAVHACPAWQKLARSMTSPEDDGMGMPELGPETAPLYIEAIKRGRKVLDRIEKALDLYAEQSPVDLGGGWEYGPHPFPNREWTLSKALPVLTEHLGPAATSCIEAKVVEKNIEAVFRDRKAQDKSVLIGKATARVIDELKAYGGLTIRYSVPVGRHKRKPEDAEILEQLRAGPPALAAGEEQEEASP